MCPCLCVRTGIPLVIILAFHMGQLVSMIINDPLLYILLIIYHLNKPQIPLNATQLTSHLIANIFINFNC